LKFLNYFIHPVIDFIYPPVCCLCGKLSDREEMPVCRPCWSSFASLDRLHPVWKEIKFRFTAGGNVADICSCYLFETDGNLQEAIHLLKYGGMTSLGVRLGSDIGRAMLSNRELMDADFIVPVPLHKRKQRERGYNQCRFICEGISRITSIPVAGSILKRTRYTQSQTQLSISERYANVNRAFEVPASMRLSVKGRSFIIVDDVITTGSTIDACAAQLILYGAARVFAVSAALAR